MDSSWLQRTVRKYAVFLLQGVWVEEVAIAISSKWYLGPQLQFCSKWKKKYWGLLSTHSKYKLSRRRVIVEQMILQMEGAVPETVRMKWWIFNKIKINTSIKINVGHRQKSTIAVAENCNVWRKKTSNSETPMLISGCSVPSGGTHLRMNWWEWTTTLLRVCFKGWYIRPSSDIKMTDNWHYSSQLLGIIITYFPTNVTIVTIGWLIIDSCPLGDTAGRRILAESSWDV